MPKTTEDGDLSEIHALFRKKERREATERDLARIKEIQEEFHNQLMPEIIKGMAKLFPPKSEAEAPATKPETPTGK